MTYWEAVYILEQGSLDYGKVLEAEAVALKVLKELIKKFDEAKDAKFREVPVKGPLYGTRSDAIFVDEFVGGGREVNDRPTLGGYLELLFKVFITMTVLIFWGVMIAALALAVPFMLSLVFVLALTAAGAFAFSWEYVWIGAIFFLILFAASFN